MAGIKRLLVCGAVLLFAASTCLLVARKEELGREQEAFAALAERAAKRRAQIPAIEQTPETGAVLDEYKELYQENASLAGWLRVEGTGIDYPVMFTPDEPEYYLHRDFWGQDSFAGTPFIGHGTVKPRSRNLVIYGHHMKNGTMFAGLFSYREKEFYKEHPWILFDTLYERQRYRIFGVFYTSDTGNEGFCFYQPAETEEAYEGLVQEMKEAALYDTGIVPGGEPLLLLSTCSYHTDEGRFVVAGVLEAQREGR